MFYLCEPVRFSSCHFRNPIPQLYEIYSATVLVVLLRFCIAIHDGHAPCKSQPSSKRKHHSFSGPAGNWGGEGGKRRNPGSQEAVGVQGTGFRV